MIKAFVYLSFLFIYLFCFFGYPIFSSAAKDTRRCPNGFQKEVSPSSSRTRPRPGDSFEYVFDPSLEARIGYVFKNPDLRTITAVYRGKNKVQRKFYFWNGKPLDLLGDAVFNLSAADVLITLYPHIEGKLNMNRKLESLMNNNFQADIAASLNIGRDIYADKYLSDSKLRNDLSSSSRKELADLLEALIGAVFLDGGYIEARKLVLRLIKRKLKKYKDEDYRSLLEMDSDTHFPDTEQTAFPYSFLNDSHTKQRLEFLGYHILKLHIIEMLMEQYPGGKRLTKKQNILMYYMTQPSILSKLDPDPRLRNFEEESAQKPSNVKRAFFFFLGAVYLEEGYERTKALVARIIEEINKERNLLHNLVQKEFKNNSRIQNNKRIRLWK